MAPVWLSDMLLKDDRAHNHPEGISLLRCVGLVDGQGAITKLRRMQEKNCYRTRLVCHVALAGGS